MEEMASPSLLERNHAAVTLDPDSLKLRISLSSTYREKEEVTPVVEDECEEDEEQENENTKVGIPWNESLYESLRLCRKRAYCKVQSKRRLHLPACLSVYLHREWNSLHPQYKIKPRDLLDVYETRFEGGSKRRKPYVRKAKKNLPTNKAKSVQWSPSTLMHLSLIGQKVDKLLAENPQLDYSSKLQEEWLKYYPDSALTGRNLKARLFLYNKTRPDYASHSKKSDTWNKQAIDLLVKIYNQLNLDEKSSLKLGDSLLHYWKEGYKGLMVVTSGELVAKIEELLEKEPDLFSIASTQNGDSENHSESNNISAVAPEEPLPPEPRMPSWDYRLPLPPKCEWACSKHWVHIFQEGSCEIDCSLTEDLVNIRNSLKDFYPNCDIFEKPYLKQPRKAGLVGAILSDWTRRHPNYDDSVKSIVSRLYKYDRIPEVTHFVPLENRLKFKIYQNGDSKNNDEVLPAKLSEDIEWTEEMLCNLKETREFAEMKAEENANGTPSLQAVTRIWKNRWKSIYPDLNFDWKLAVEKYNTHCNYSSSLVNDEVNNSLKMSRLKSDPTVASSEDSEVKGFRQWNVNMKQGLINTKANIIKSLYPQPIDLQSKQFATLLFNEFRKLFPKCMESTRSLLSKLQSIEKEGFVPLQHQIEKPPSEDTVNGYPSPFLKDSEYEPINNMPNLEDKSCSDSLSVSVPPIVGFSNWSITMIRDFIACMDAARRKYASLKGESASNKQSQPRLIPLLLNEWKEIYPESTETDKTFLEKIKHLKAQKESIKAYLNQSGLLPRRDLPLEEDKMESTDNCEEKLNWDKSMIEDVIRTRDAALKRLGEVQTKGRKVSFHHTWWEEFKKIYPNCSFGKNSLSAHYWKWKKTQKTCQKPEPVSRTETRNNSMTKKCYSNWTKEDKDQLLDLAFKLQKDMDHEAIKQKGFGAVLRDQWKLLRPDREDHPSTLNLLYAKYLKEIKVYSANSEIIVEKDGKLKNFKWTPKHNRVLRQCLMNCQIDKDDETYTQGIIGQWRKSFPSSLMSDTEISERLGDLKESLFVNFSWYLTPEARKHLNIVFARVFRQTLKRRRMRKDLVILPEKKLELASNLHRAFLRKFADCSLSPGALLNECDLFRGKQSPTFDEDNDTWTPLMMKNMLETRRIALQEKKSSPNPEAFNFADIWYQKFIKLHPEYLSTKRNLIRKYKWHKSQSEQTGSIHSDNIFSSIGNDATNCDQISIPSKHIRKDFLQHIKSLVENSEICLPPRLPPKEEFFKSGGGSPPPILKEEPSTEDNEEDKQCFHFPGGAKLIPIQKPPVDIKEEKLLSQDEDGDEGLVTLSVFKIPIDVESRLKEFDLTAKDFHDLLSIYVNAREEYISFIKKGFFAFFPFILQMTWKRRKISNNNSSTASKYSKVTGRNLAGLVEMFLEKFYKSRGEPFPPAEVLTKVPRKFNVTELTLKQVITCFAEAMSSPQMECSKDVDAFESWKILYPKMCFSFKELISLHRMLIFEANQEVDLLESLTLDCAIADIWSQFTHSDKALSSSHLKTETLDSKYDLSNVSIEQLKDWYFKTKYIPSSMGYYAPPTSRPRYGVRNIKLFWSNERIQDLETCYIKAEAKLKLTRRSKPRLKPQSSFLTLMHREWKKLHPEKCIDSRVIVGKYVSYMRRRRKEKSLRENLLIQEWNLDVLNFLESEDSTIPEPDAPDEMEQDSQDHVFDPHDDEDQVGEVTVEEVLRRIDEKGRRSVVWTSSVMRDLLKAREESRRKKKEIEKDSRLQKVDNLFLEEWKKIRPKLGHLSIWTLNAYVRKFDQFRNKLIQLRKSEYPKAETRCAPIKYFPQSCIPIYDVVAVQNLKEVSQEVKDLLITRQRAMETKVLKKSNYTLDYLWPLEWKKIYGVEMHANQLKNKLWSVERFPKNMERLRVALTREPLPYETISHPNGHNDSYMPILPRRYIFPEEQILRAPFKFNHQVSFNDSNFGSAGLGRVPEKRKIYSQLSLCSEFLSVRESSLDIPKIRFEKQILAPADDECSEDVLTRFDNELYWDKFQPKRRKLDVPVAKPIPPFSCDSSGSFVCDECGKKFRNINNYEYHMQMH